MGFTLVEVLVALVILLIGAYAALTIFPGGFQAIERSRLESQAGRLADEEIQRWRLAAGSLPEAIVWGDSSSGALIYRTDYDPNDLTPVALSPRTGQPNPNWQPDSAYLPRTIIGETLPVGDLTVTVNDPANPGNPAAVGIRAPLCRLRFGPLMHLYDNPADGSPLFIYTSEYERVNASTSLSDTKDWGRYYINYERRTAANVNGCTISFDRAPYYRRFRVEFSYLTAAGPGAHARHKLEMFDIALMISVVANEDTVATPKDLLAALPATPQPLSIVPLSERVHQALIQDTDDWQLNGPGYFKLIGEPADTADPINQTNAYLLFHPGDAGRTVSVDYRVRDWQILLEERELTFTPRSIISGGAARNNEVVTLTTATDHGFQVDDWVRVEGVTSTGGTNFNGSFRITSVISNRRFTYDQDEANDTGGDGTVKSPRISLAVGPVKHPEYVNPPRQPSPDQLVTGDPNLVIVLDTADGRRLFSSEFAIDFGRGMVFLIGSGVNPAPQSGTTYRIYYRGERDWTMQPIKAAADYSVIPGGSAPIGYREALWTPTGRELDFGLSELGKSVVTNYYMYAPSGEPTLVSGELHPVVRSGDRAIVTLNDPPAWPDIRVQGASMRARVLWAGRGATKAVGAPGSPESWRKVSVQTFLRR